MSTSFPKKNKVDLTEYDYRKDIENRLLMATFTSLEVDVLHEILNNSLQFSISQLQESLEADLVSITSALQKLARTKLIRLNGSIVQVDKEMRKYYEWQVLKFKDGFVLGMEFLQGLLSKVPIHVLPLWYNITRLNDNIFSSIIEKYFITPKVYERHLIETGQENELLSKIYQDVIHSPAFELPAHYIMEKYALSHESFEECMLQLEYNFICCLSYRRKEEAWEEVVVPFIEWREYLQFINSNASKTIRDRSSIVRMHMSDFGFVHDMSTILSRLPLSLEQKNKEKVLSPQKLLAILPHLALLPSPENYVQAIQEQMLSLGLVKNKGSSLSVSEEGASWLKAPVYDQALLLYRNFINLDSAADLIDKDMREVEKGLKSVAKLDWIYLDDFISSMTVPIGNSEHITLKNKGKRWKYAPPVYTEKERKIIEKTLETRLFQAGMVALGTHNGKKCLSVTPFGRITLDD